MLEERESHFLCWILRDILDYDLNNTLLVDVMLVGKKEGKGN